MTNPQIAARLFLSHRTVATHVSHILGKLDVRSRIDIAREVTDRRAVASVQSGSTSPARPPRRVRTRAEPQRLSRDGSCG